MNKSVFRLSNNILKIIAIVLMTIDHIGLALEQFPATYNSGLILRYIGRLALPIFCFLIVEGIMHTKSLAKYLLRMTYMSIFITICLFIIHYTIPLYESEGNIFMLFVLAILTVYLLSLQKNYKYLAILPFLYVVFTFIVQILEVDKTIDFSEYFPSAIRPEYSLLGYALIIGTYFVLRYYSKATEDKCRELNVNYLAYKNSDEFKKKYNMLASTIVIFVTIIFTLLKYFSYTFDIYNFSIQSYMVIAIIFIMFYSHKLGYSNIYTKYGFYLYYPLHIAVIFGIVMLINML